MTTTLEHRLYDADSGIVRLQPSKSAGSKLYTHMEGLAVPYNVWSDVGGYVERMAPSVFRKSIKEAARALPLQLWHDDHSFPIGAIREWRDNPESGLGAVWRIDSSERAQEAARMAAEEIMTGLSVGFQPVAGGSDIEMPDHEDRNGRIRITRNTARLLEISLVNVPAYEGAGVTLVRNQSRRVQEGHPYLDQWREWRGTLA